MCFSFSEAPGAEMNDKFPESGRKLTKSNYDRIDQYSRIRELDRERDTHIFSLLCHLLSS